MIQNSFVVLAIVKDVVNKKHKWSVLKNFSVITNVPCRSESDTSLTVVEDSMKTAFCYMVKNVSFDFSD